jgi:hypothetical protein
LDHAVIAISTEALETKGLSTSGKAQLHVADTGDCATEVEVRGWPKRQLFLAACDADRLRELFDDHKCDIATTNRVGS